MRGYGKNPAEWSGDRQGSGVDYRLYAKRDVPDKPPRGEVRPVRSREDGVQVITRSAKLPPRRK